MTRFRVVALSLVMMGCFGSDPPDGAYLCRAAEPRCPSGYYCAPSGTCWRDGHADDPQQGIAVLAGGIGLAGDADGVGQAARFRSPASLCSDGADRLYVAEGGNNIIRQIVVSTGEVTTIAGLAGELGAGSKDGVSALARFARPTGITTDGAGNLFVADTGNSTIRRIEIATATVTTLAGLPQMEGVTDGKGALARFRQPDGITTDGRGNLYVADRLSHTIRRVVIETGEVTTVAGVPQDEGNRNGPANQALFSSPIGVAADEHAVYITDENLIVRRLDLASADVSTVADAEGRLLRLVRPIGIAIEPSGALKIADNEGHAILRLEGAKAVIWAGSEQPMLTLGARPGSVNKPYGLAHLPSGVLAVTDSTDQVVLLIR